MAREHHCPNCGPQACNATTSKIHTCGVCATIWEEDLSVPVPPPAAPRPATPAPATSTPATAVSLKPAAPAAAPSKPMVTAPAAASTPAATRPSVPPTPSEAPNAPAFTKTVTPSPVAAPASTPFPANRPVPLPPPGGNPTLDHVVRSAKVKRCPACQSDGVGQPIEFLTVQGRVVLIDSQTYRAHQWYADTGELLPSVASPAPTESTPAPAPAARAAPAT